jgi:hypothetical protein
MRTIIVCNSFESEYYKNNIHTIHYEFDNFPGYIENEDIFDLNAFLENDIEGDISVCFNEKDKIPEFKIMKVSEFLELQNVSSFLCTSFFKVKFKSWTKDEKGIYQNIFVQSSM